MAYSPTTWTTGDTITAEKMNHLEQGVANEQVGPQGPKGETGPAGADGADGAAAGFGTPTATDDATNDAPSVTVQATYVPTNWKTGDVITATKLNNMENGISDASNVLNSRSILKYTTLNGSSFNSSTDSGIYYGNGTFADGPIPESNGLFSMLVMRYSLDWIFQLVVVYSSASSLSNSIFIRKKYSEDSWSEWEKLF